jgi:hypothetical protein
VMLYGILEANPRDIAIPIFGMLAAWSMAAL